MRVFTITGLAGPWPVGTGAVVVAYDKETARNLLQDELHHIGLKQSIELDQLTELDPDTEQAVILLQKGEC